MLSVVELTAHAKQFLKQEFDLNLDIPIAINGRLSSTLGRFRFSHTTGAMDIAVAKSLVLYNSNEKVLDVLNHELIHYALHELGLPFDDSDKTFIMACKQRSVVLTGSQSFDRKKHVYQCPDCGIEHTTSTRTRTRTYSCRKCSKVLQYMGQRVC